jgi:hypothetical protein
MQVLRESRPLRYRSGKENENEWYPKSTIESKAA